ncbi:unnamed protein product (macronuclear) [Paramecium tetraurelia]|uniref:Ubiquitin-like domain-containing protein n=1 Tax=Paramecium tetraurelia TaxID=5888 RepID=A0EDK7_PARTE|nr:uncharacterized protein GSPATT00025717001 [Paramecium tetraurelia]CAK93374.1 unnamed protein product [Paramecium tetraurelia]|eukprot:XP_001460771.1 hypothetical protein (macronuclear) [Paramecium tetraurelia strain d4-2]
MISILRTFFCLLCGSRKERQLLMLTIQDQNHNMYYIKAKPNMKIEEVKTKCGIESERSSLFLEKTLLDDEAELKEYEITSDTHLTLLVHTEIES